MSTDQSLVGQRFSRLVVQSEAPSAGYRKRWLCLCDCGGTHTVSTGNLVNDQVKSCGCLSRSGKAVRDEYRTLRCSCGEKRQDQFPRYSIVCNACAKRAASHPSLWKRPEVSHAA